MILAIVKGNVVSTNKTEKLSGSKLLIVEEWNVDTGKASGQPRVALDLMGAGEGELVMCVSGSSARQTEQTDKRPVDMAIIGIVDQVEMEGKNRYRKYPSAEDREQAARTEKPAPRPAAAKPAEKPVEKPADKPAAAAKPAAPKPAANKDVSAIAENKREVELAAERFRKIVSDSNEALKTAGVAPRAPKTHKPEQPKQ